MSATSLVAVLVLAGPAAAPEQGLDLVVRAFEAQSLSRGPEALTLYSRARDQCRAEGDPGCEALALSGLGSTQAMLRDWRAAITSYQAALAIQRGRGDKPGQAGSLYGLGSAHADLGEPGDAIPFFEQALELQRAVGNRRGEAGALVGLGSAHRDLRQWRRALPCFQEALPLFRAEGDRLGEGFTLNGISAIAASLGETRLALECARQALPIFQGLHLPQGELVSLFNIGSGHADLDDLSPALEYLGRALALARAQGDRSTEARALNGMARVREARGERRQALEQYQQAAALFGTIGEAESEAAALGNIGAVYHDLGDGDRALDHFQRALAVQRSSGDRAGEGSTLVNIGAVHGSRGDRRLEIEHDQKALAIFRAIGARGREASTLNNIGTAHGHLGERELEVSSYEQAIAIHRATGDRIGEATALANLGGAYRDLGRRQHARASYDDALGLFVAVGNAPGEAAVLARLMRLELASSPSLAILYGKQAVNGYQSLRGELRGIDRELRRSYGRSASAAYRMLAGLLLSEQRLDEAQQVLLLLKEEELDQLVPRRTGERRARLALLPEEAEAIRAFRRSAEDGARAAAEQAELWRVRERTPEQERRLAALQRELEARRVGVRSFLARLSPRFASGRAPKRAAAAPTGLMRDLAALGPGTAVIFTLASEETLRTILVTADSQQAYQTPLGAEALWTKVRALRAAVQDPGQDPRALAQELHAALLGPMAADLERAGATHLLWSLDGALRYLPVAALFDGNRWLVERYRSVVMTPESVLRPGPGPRRSWDVLGVGVTRGHEGLAALPGVREELLAVVREPTEDAGILPGQRLVDEAFTRDRLMRALARRPAVLHVASHYVLRTEGPSDGDGSFLLLGDGGHLTLRDWDAMPPGALEGLDLLALSACDTAMGRFESRRDALEGAEMDGLAILAQQKGAAAVLATLWRVADASTAALMREFYRGHDSPSGQDLAAGLRSAQLALLRGLAPRAVGAARGAELLPASAPAAPELAGWRHPYYWAPFVLVGRWR